MPFNGSGVFVRNYSWVTDQANAIQVNATRMDADTNDIANGLSQCVTKDGQSGALTANLQMGSNKITGLANGTANNDAVNFGQVFTAPTFTGVTLNGATVTGTASFTGTLNASGATSVLVPTPTLAGQAVNLSTLNAAVTAGGNAPIWVSGTTYTIGQLVFSPINFQTYRRKIAGAGTTDPSLDSTNWTFLGGSGTGGTTLTGNVTLTASSPAAMSVTPANPGLYVTLPDATTVSRSTAPFSVYNNGDFDYGVRDSAGTQLGWIRARTGAVIGLADNSTAAGVWAYYGLEKTGITASYVNSTLANMGSTIRRIALDANRTCFLFGGTDCYAIVYDASTQTWGSATLVRSGVAGGAFIGVLSATNQVLVVSCDSGTSGQAVTLTISGTVVTVNSPVGFTTIAVPIFGQFIAVGSSFVAGYGRTGNFPAIQAFTVSGTVPTFGLETALAIGVASSVPAIFASGSVVRAVSTSATVVRSTPYTVSGTTLTIGTAASATTTAQPFRAFLNGNGRIVCHYINTTHFATIFSLSGTTETASSVSLGTSPINLLANSDYVQVTASKTAFVYMPLGSQPYFNILTDTAGTASAGTEIQPSTLYAINSNSVCGGFANGNTAVFSISATPATSEAVVAGISINCSGSSPTLVNLEQFPTRTFANSTGAIFGTVTPSNSQGARAASTLIAGSNLYNLFGAYVACDFRVSLNGIAAPSSLKARMLPSAALGNGGVAGAANNESFNAQSNGIGITIQRIEAAA